LFVQNTQEHLKVAQSHVKTTQNHVKFLHNFKNQRPPSTSFPQSELIPNPSQDEAAQKLKKKLQNKNLVFQKRMQTSKTKS
jgi:hypothetical protein